MKTTQGKAISAFTTLAQMGRKPINSLSAYKLFRLKKALSHVVEFQSEQEYKLIDELGGTVTESGAISLDREGAEKYRARHKELEETECEIDTDRVELRVSDIPEISVSDIESLETFIDWKE